MLQPTNAWLHNFAQRGFECSTRRPGTLRSAATGVFAPVPLTETVDFHFLSSVILSRSRDGTAVSHQAERREAEQTSPRGAFRKDLAAHSFAP